MADESLHLPSNQNLDYHIITLFQRLESMRKQSNIHRIGAKLSSTRVKHNMQVEIRTLEFWRSIFAELMGSFLYVFIVCGAAAGAGVGASISSVLLATALASGFVMTALTQCFSHVSGAHINPAVTFGMLVMGAISPLRAAMYIIGHCGGGIAGAALLYGVTVPGYQGNLQAAITHSAGLAAWERFCVECILTFIVVLVFYMSTDSYKSYFGVSALSIGAAYSACSFVSMPYLNPARSFGPSFVLSKWDNHWVYWIGPLVGGAAAGLIYQYVFNPRRSFKLKRDIENDGSSVSDDDTNFDIDSEKPYMQQPKFHASTFRSPTGTLQQPGDYCPNLYTTNGMNKFDHSEPLYSGTRSLYTKSPPLTRANLNRSQSVYAKSNTAINRDPAVPRPGPLVPAQSLHTMRMNQMQMQNQNLQNHLNAQQRSESIYGIRSSIRLERTMPPPSQMQPENTNIAFQGVYGTRTNPSPGDDRLCKFEREPQRDMREESKVFVNRSCRPESMYGMAARRPQTTISDDSSHCSYNASSTPMSQMSQMPLMQTNYAAQTAMRTQPPQHDRKLSTNGSCNTPTNGERQNYAPIPKQTHNGASSNAPLTHQYQMQPQCRPNP